MTITVIGKNSLIGRNLLDNPLTTGWQFLTHQQALESGEWIGESGIIINLAFSPQLKKVAYDESLDIDGKIVRLIRPCKIHYIMMSSRTVYGPATAPDGCISESQHPQPQTPYGRNKLIIEQKLEDILGEERLTILRASNVFGHESGRPSFFGMALDSLKKNNEIVFDMNAATRRDFIAVWRLAESLIEITKAPQAGLFNLGSGIPLSCRQIAQWIIEGYGQGSIRQTQNDIRDDFYLDISRTTATFGIHPLTPEQIKNDCIQCGAAIR